MCFFPARLCTIIAFFLSLQFLYCWCCRYCCSMLLVVEYTRIYELYGVAALLLPYIRMYTVLVRLAFVVGLPLLLFDVVNI